MASLTEVEKLPTDEELASLVNAPKPPVDWRILENELREKEAERTAQELGKLVQKRVRDFFKRQRRDYKISHSVENGGKIDQVYFRDQLIAQRRISQGEKTVYTLFTPDPEGIFGGTGPAVETNGTTTHIIYGYGRRLQQKVNAVSESGFYITSCLTPYLPEPGKPIKPPPRSPRINNSNF